MNRPIKISLTAIGILLLIIGVGNMMEDARVLVFDISSILSGTGFLIISSIKVAPPPRSKEL